MLRPFCREGASNLMCCTDRVSRSEFFSKNYASIKAANAKLPVLLRECNGTAAKVTATYGGLTPKLLPWHDLSPPPFAKLPMLSPFSEFGVEKSVDLEGLAAGDVDSHVKALMKGS